MRNIALALVFLLAASVARAQGPPSNPPFRATYFNFMCFVQALSGTTVYYFSKNAAGVTTAAADARPCAYWSIVNKNAVAITMTLGAAQPTEKIAPLTITIEPGDAWYSNGATYKSIRLDTTSWGGTPDSVLVSVED